MYSYTSKYLYIIITNQIHPTSHITVSQNTHTNPPTHAHTHSHKNT